MTALATSLTSARVGRGLRIDGVEHLRGGDDRLVGGVALADHFLLRVRHLLGRDLDAEVAAGDHAAGGVGQDVVEVLDAEGTLDLRIDRDVVAAVLVADLADLLDALAVADEGGGDRVDADLATEDDVLAVAVSHRGEGDVDAGDVDTLALAQVAGVGEGAVDVGAVDGVDVELKQAIVDQDAVARLDLVGEVLEVEGETLMVADDVVISGDDGLVAGLEVNLLAVLEHAGADLGALGVEHDGDGDAKLGRDLADALDAGTVVIVGAVGEVEAGDVHAGLDELGEDGLVFGGRTHGADDLGLLGLHFFPFA